MIAVDASALMAIALAEPRAKSCLDILRAEDHVLISAGTVTEALIVAAQRAVTEEVTALVDGLNFDVVAVTHASARRAAAAYARWGKGGHPAGLNFGDCFAYEVAMNCSCALLYVGNDFAKTDVRSALCASRSDRQSKTRSAR